MRPPIPLLLRAFVTFCALLAAAPSARATVPHGPVPRTTGEIHVDGTLDEPTWATALPIDIGYEIKPADNGPAPVRGVCLLAYDEGRLYIGFRALDPDPAQIRAHVADRDSVFRNDIVGIVLEPFRDGRRGFSFMVNPLGVQMDAMLDDVGGLTEDYTWDAIWDSAGRITPDGYEVEIAIPFSSLRFPRGATSQTWGVLPFRNWPRDVMHNLQAVPKDRNRNCYFCQIGSVDGLQGMVPGRNIELIPTLTVGRTDERVEDGTMAEGDVDNEFGLSARWGVTPNLQLNATVNPDFSQVEADAPQLTINRPFALFYPEKRPFFQEGADFFSAPLRVVYTRQIADPAWGGKLSGKEGRNALGLFVVRDEVTNLLFPGPTSSSGTLLEDLENTTGVFRWRRDVDGGSNVGVIGTVREAEGYHNRVGGIDAAIRLDGNNKITALVLQSSTRYSDEVAAANAQPAGSFDGRIYEAWYERTGREWEWWAGGSVRDAGFRADTGLIPRVDLREGSAGVERIWWGNGGSWFNVLRAGTNTWAAETRDGAFLRRGTELYARYEGPLQSTVRLTAWGAREGFGGKTFDTSGGEFFFNIRPTGDFTTSIEVDAGHAIDYEGVRPGRVLSLEPGFTWNIGRHLYTQFDHVWEEFTLDEGDALLYRVHQSQLRLVYQFNVRLFVRAIVQRTLLREQTGTFEDIGAQYLVSYKVNPQTVFFLGYSDSHEALGGGPRTIQDRTFFAKLGYAWVM